MNIDKTNIDEKDAVILVEIPAEEAGKAIKETLADFRRKANIPGFRPGKVPMDLIRKRFGDDLMQEKAEEIAREKLSDVIKEAEVEPGGPVDIRLLAFGEDLPLKFEVIFPLKPVVNLVKYRGLKLTINDTEVTDAEIDKEIKAQQMHFMEFKEIEEPATSEAKISLKVQEVDPSGLPLIGRESEDVEFEFGMDQLGIGTDEQLLEIKAGEKRIIHSEANGLSSSSSLILTPQEAAQGTKDQSEAFYSVEAVKVTVPELPELNDEFVKKVNPSLNTVEELRKWIEIQLISMVTYSKRQEMQTGLVNKLIEENPFPISQRFIDMFIGESAQENNIPGDKIEEYFQNNRKDVEKEYRWMLLKDSIADVEKLVVEDEEIDAEFQKISDQVGKSLEEVKAIYSKEENAVEQLRDRMVERKIVEFLGQNADIEKVMLSLDDFAKASQATH